MSRPSTSILRGICPPPAPVISIVKSTGSPTSVVSSERVALTEASAAQDLCVKNAQKNKATATARKTAFDFRIDFKVFIVTNLLEQEQRLRDHSTRLSVPRPSRLQRRARLRTGSFRAAGRGRKAAAIPRRSVLVVCRSARWTGLERCRKRPHSFARRARGRGGGIVRCLLVARSLGFAAAS